MPGQTLDFHIRSLSKHHFFGQGFDKLPLLLDSRRTDLVHGQTLDRVLTDFGQRLDFLSNLCPKFVWPPFSKEYRKVFTKPLTRVAAGLVFLWEDNMLVDMWFFGGASVSSLCRYDLVPIFGTYPTLLDSDPDSLMFGQADPTSTGTATTRPRPVTFVLIPWECEQSFPIRLWIGRRLCIIW